MPKNQSEYDIYLERVAAESVKVTISDAENFRIIEELNDGMESFLLKQKKNERDCAIELTGITLNA